MMDLQMIPQTDLEVMKMKTRQKTFPRRGREKGALIGEMLSKYVICSPSHILFGLYYSVSWNANQYCDVRTV